MVSIFEYFFAKIFQSGILWQGKIFFCDVLIKSFYKNFLCISFGFLEFSIKNRNLWADRWFWSLIILEEISRKNLFARESRNVICILYIFSLSVPPDFLFLFELKVIFCDNFLRCESDRRNHEMIFWILNTKQTRLIFGLIVVLISKEKLSLWFVFRKKTFSVHFMGVWIWYIWGK